MYSENYKTLMKTKMTQINRELYHNHGSEKLILLSGPFYSWQSMYSMQPLSMYQYQ